MTDLIVACHSCGDPIHASHHAGLCAMCSQEREFCCECWDAEDTSCRREFEHDYEPEDVGA